MTENEDPTWLRPRYSTSKKEYAAAIRDIEAMCEDNEYLSAELKDASGEIDRLSSELREAKDELSRLNEAIEEVFRIVNRA